MVMRRSKEGVDWLEFSILAGLKHGSMLRNGGVCQGECDSLNFAFDRDVEANVYENFSRTQKVLELDTIRYVSQQMHGVTIVEVNRSSPIVLPPCDALVTADVDVPLLIRHADCQAAIFYDPGKRVLALAHAGWRGSVQNIYGEVIKTLQIRYGCQPSDLLVGISPSLGPQSAEFINYRTELPETFWKYQTIPSYFDFWAISQAHLMECGVRPEHIELARMCTYINTKDCFSARRNREAGRHGTVACM